MKARTSTGTMTPQAGVTGLVKSGGIAKMKRNAMITKASDTTGRLKFATRPRKNTKCTRKKDVRKMFAVHGTENGVNGPMSRRLRLARTT